MMKPENIKLAEELDFSGPVSYLLNRFGKRVVGCSTQAIWNLMTVLNEWPKGADPMDGLMTIRAGIKEKLDTQGASPQDVISFLKSEPILAEQIVDAFYTEQWQARDIILLLRQHVVLLFTLGVDAIPGQAHLGILHISNKRLYLDGTELDIEAVARFLYSSKQNFAIAFRR